MTQHAANRASDEIANLRAEVAEYKRETEMAYADCADAITALRFYADPMNYASGDVSLDNGKLARSALFQAK